MGVINQIPEGFLDLIKAKTGGRNPTEIGDQVVPTLEMGQFYLGRAMSHAFASSASSAIGAQVDIEVPDGETWLLFAADFSYQRASSTQRLHFQLELSHLPDAPSPLNAIAIYNSPRDVSDGFDNLSFPVAATTFLPPIVLPPGVLISGSIIDENNITIVWTLNLGIYKLRT